MAIIEIEIPDEAVSRVQAVIDYMYGGRLLESPVPTQLAWLKKGMAHDLKYKVFAAEKANTAIEEIDIS